MKKSKFKIQRFTPSGGKNIGIRKPEFVTKTQFLCLNLDDENVFSFLPKN